MQERLQVALFISVVTCFGSLAVILVGAAQERVPDTETVYFCSGDPRTEGAIDHCIERPTRIEVRRHCSNAAPCEQARFLERVLRQPVWRGLRFESYFITWSNSLHTIVLRGRQPETTTRRADGRLTEERVVNRVITANSFQAAMERLLEL